LPTISLLKYAKFGNFQPLDVLNAMIACPVCGRSNDDLRTTCIGCGSFLQGRVDVLDLFATLWGLLEAPQRTMKRIALARHKNYTLVLSALFGVGLVLDIAWYKRLAEQFGSLIALVGTAVLAGPPAGLVTVLVVSLLLQRLTRLFGGHATLRNLYATTAFALFPFVAVLVFVVPLEIGIFGLDFFGTNPPPMVIKPVEYSILLALKAIAALYAVFLLIEGTMAANAFAGVKRLPVLLSVIAVVGVCISTVHFLQWR
jgi:hypothetical protein